MKEEKGMLNIYAHTCRPPEEGGATQDMGTGASGTRCKKNIVLRRVRNGNSIRACYCKGTL